MFELRTVGHNLRKKIQNLLANNKLQQICHAHLPLEPVVNLVNAAEFILRAAARIFGKKIYILGCCSTGGLFQASSVDEGISVYFLGRLLGGSC